ncbi:uncharacterized protein E6C27_scaffold36G001940 [Cucumis melo var. makuwa]|uniref:Ubiquitin-like protease family profile domain-containing protein n=1 Tax=Cucumis melo var. makuwa TaxID=1194695 RepID=A0A5A7T957_CUCMM|nr:uncharacterized protein E6C27_scaffold36G001940 [Cucumis melo var. makuwa]
MTLGKQARLEAGCSSVPSTEGVINKGKGTHGPTGISEITRVSYDGHKRVVEYNEPGQPIRESATKLKSFIGTTVWVHVPISYQSWKDVPTELKDKIYELIEGGFVVDPRSKKSILQNASVCFRNFKSSLTTKHVLPYKKDLEKLKNPPTEYSFIDREHWNIFVASRLTEQFEMVSNKGRERRKNNKYNHRMSRKGYANLTEEMKASTSNGELIDRALVWKKARTTKDGEIPDIDTKEVANKIDNLLVSKRASHSMDNVTCDILSQAIGGNDPPGRIRGVGQYVTPKLEAELMKHKKVPEVATKEETDESKIKSQMASKSIDTSDDANDHDAKEENRQVLEDLTIEDLTIEKQDKVGEENKYVCASIETLTKVKDGTSCRLAIGTKDNVVGAETIFYYYMDSNNVKVSVDMVTDGNCFVPVPTREGRTMLSQEMKSVYQTDPRLPSLTLNTKRAPVTLRLLLWELDYIGSKIQIHVPAKGFGYERKCCIFLEALQEFCQMQPISTQCIDAFMFHLYKVMEENGTLGSYKFADAGSVSVAIDFSRGTAYWIDPLRNRINNDASDVVQMAFDISNKKKSVWRIIKCPKQGGIVECGYYVMRFMRDIILSSNRTIIEVHRCLWNGGGKSMFRFINDLGSGERDGGSAKFMFKLNFDFRRGEGVGNWGGGIHLCLIMTLEGGSELLRLEMTWGAGGWD